LTWKDIEDGKKAQNDLLGEVCQENTLKNMFLGHPEFKNSKADFVNWKNNFDRFINLLSIHIRALHPKLWSSLILFSLQKEMLSKCFPEEAIDAFIPLGSIESSKAKKQDPGLFAYIKELSFDKELLFEIFIHPQSFKLKGFSRYDGDKFGWEKENWNKFWGVYNLTQFHGMKSFSYKEGSVPSTKKSDFEVLLQNFDPELHDIVKTLIENSIQINEEFDFDFMENDEIIAQAELGSHETKFFCRPFDEDSRKVFNDKGYREINIESFDINSIKL